MPSVQLPSRTRSERGMQACEALGRLCRERQNSPSSAVWASRVIIMIKMIKIDKRIKSGEKKIKMESLIPFFGSLIFARCCSKCFNALH